MYIGYLNYVIIICCISGILILITDVKAYKRASMKKEQKISRILGWVNISLGASLLVVNWLYSLLIW